MTKRILPESRDVSQHSSGRTARRFIRTALAGVTAFALFGAALTSGFAQSTPSGGNVDFAWVQAEGTDQTPDAHYQINSTGGTNTIARSGPGVYTVTLPGLGVENAGSVQVSAFADKGRAICNIGSWVPNGADMNVQVLCFDSAGAPGDSPFSMSYTNAVTGEATTDDPATSFGAYLWAGDAAATASYDLTAYAFNSAGATNSVEHTGTGTYVVTIPGFTGEGGVPQVTGYLGYGGTAPVVCSPFSWAKPEAATLTVEVDCFDAAGAPADAMFTLAYTKGDNPAGSVGPMNSDWGSGYAYIPVLDGDGSATVIDNQFSSGGGNISVLRRAGGSAAGDYHVTFDGRNSGGAPHVSPVDNSGATCSILGYGPEGENGYVDVVCFDASGANVDAAFVVQF